MKNIDNYKKRLVEKFEGLDPKSFSDDLFDKNDIKNKNKKSSHDIIKNEDLNNYRKRYETSEKDDLLKRIIQLETINLQGERVIEKMKYKLKNLEVEKEELKRLLDD